MSRELDEGSVGLEPCGTGEEEADGGVRVVYLPGDPGMNFCMLGEGTIVLDEALEEHPLAHELVREHELAHAEFGMPAEGFWRHLRLEFETDWKRFFSTSEDAVALREYFAEEGGWDGTIWDFVAHQVVLNLRLAWCFVMLPTGAAYRAAVRVSRVAVPYLVLVLVWLIVWFGKRIPARQRLR